MKKLAFLLVFLVFFTVLTDLGSATWQIERELIIYVEGTRHIEVTVENCTGPGEDIIEIKAGEIGQCIVRVENLGNTIYDREMRSPKRYGPEMEGWLTWWFECEPESQGECDTEGFSHSDYNHPDPPEVDIENLEPGNETYFLLAADLPLPNEEAEVLLELNFLDDDTGVEEWQETGNVTIVTDDDLGDDYGAFVAPGTTDVSVIILFLISTCIVALKTNKNRTRNPN